MSVPYRDEQGNIVVQQQAGGHGGGATGSMVRPATDEEVLAFHTNAIAYAEAQVLEAEQALAAAKKARDVHVVPASPVVAAPQTTDQAERDRLAQVERDRVAAADRARQQSAPVLPRSASVVPPPRGNANTGTDTKN